MNSFLIGGDLNVYEGRGWTTLLTDDSLWDGINIGYIGKYTKGRPTYDMLGEHRFENKLEARFH